MAGVLEVDCLHTNFRVIIQPNQPAVEVPRSLVAVADDTLPAVEVCGADEARQPNGKFKIETSVVIITWATSLLRARLGSGREFESAVTPPGSSLARCLQYCRAS
mmetsp:Transcript_27846/g.44679  ORF Transcript_27846/g.44679 Transcript_27846/m.44679 type:complete len:105 (-) Transcript_27846:801-1115(-)